MPARGKIARLPPELQEELRRAFVDHAYGDVADVTEWFNGRMKEWGIAITIGKSAIGVEMQKVKRAQETIAAVTRNMQLIADTAVDDSDKRGEALNAMVSTEMFETLLLARESEQEMDPAKRMGLINKAALAAARLSNASVRQRKYRAEVEARVKAAGAAVTKIAKKGGMDKATVDQILSSILGITQREPRDQATS